MAISTFLFCEVSPQARRLELSDKQRSPNCIDDLRVGLSISLNAWPPNCIGDLSVDPAIPLATTRLIHLPRLTFNKAVFLELGVCS